MKIRKGDTILFKRKVDGSAQEAIISQVLPNNCEYVAKLINAPVTLYLRKSDIIKVLRVSKMDITMKYSYGETPECIHSHYYGGKRFFCCHTWRTLHTLKQGNLTFTKSKCIYCGRVEILILIYWEGNK